MRFVGKNEWRETERLIAANLRIPGKQELTYEIFVFADQPEKYNLSERCSCLYSIKLRAKGKAALHPGIAIF